MKIMILVSLESFVIATSHRRHVIAGIFVMSDRRN